MSRYFIDRLSKRTVFCLGLLALVILASIFVYILTKSLPAWNEIGIFNILFGTEWYPRYNLYGILPMLAGSVVVTLLALVMAVPLSLGCAVFLAEVAPKRIHQMTRPAVELLAGIPSVVFGLVGMTVLLPVISNISGRGSGSSVLGGAMVLAIMVIPTITTISEDSIRLVPTDYKEAALALGATRWQTVRHVLLPAASRGIIASIVLGTGRAIGETMAMVMVIGNSPIFPTDLFGPTRTLTGNIAVEIAGATGIHESALFATGLVLFVLVMFINSTGLLIYRRRNQ